MKLFEIDDAIEQVLNEEVDQETGEITPEAEARLDALVLEKERVALSIARYLKGEIVEGAAVKVEADRLARRAKVHENRAKWLTDYLGKFLKPDECYKDAAAEILWRHSQFVDAPDVEQLPSQFIREKTVTTREPDKLALAVELKKGTQIKGATLVKRSKLVVK